MARLMSDAEIRRRKKAQGAISRTTSTIGLAGVGIGTAAALASKKPGTIKHIRKVPGLKRATPEGLKDAGLYTSLASGGIGGVGGYNFAAYTGAESRKRKAAVVPPPKKVRKEMGPVEMGHYGEEGRPIKLPEIKVPIEKAWSPVASNFDSEAKRHKRSKTYEGAALVGAGGAGAYAGHQGLKAVQAGRDLKPQNVATVVRTKQKTKSGGERTVPKVSPSQSYQAVPLKGLKGVGAHGGKAAAGVGAVAAAAAGHKALKRKRKTGSWQSYGKRDTTSAFGVDHD